MNDSQPGNFLVLLELMAKRSRFLISFVLICTLSAVVVSLILPKWYKATATLLPPKEMTVPIGGLGEFAKVVSVTSGLDLPVLVTPSDIYAKMLASRTISESIIRKFRLLSRYETDNLDETYEALMSNSDFRVTPEGLVTVAVQDKSPQMAADLANAFVAMLDSTNRDIAGQRAKYNKDFIVKRLAQVKRELDSSRTLFERFQIEYKAVDFEQQTKLVTNRAIDLKIRQAKVELDVEMAALEFGKGNPKLVELRSKSRIIAEQLDKLENENPDNSFFSVPISEIPTLRGKYEMLYSQVKVNEKLYEILLEQRERAKIQLSENSPTISVLDPARVPSIRSRPQRTLIVVASFGFSLIMAIFIAGTAEYFERLRKSSPEQYLIVQSFISSYFGWLPGVRMKRSQRVEDD